ncbi:hypothetical protein EYF80_016348 [Liparis tanakae]|uniref:Uncharacterized protein n=1 Tax=Liparis tanakae TaxID=230148 RepID=A0A4Z2I7U1_9TELE|nr:hypothetical protein EYF80_016348 [Liparis tanakae]
MKTVMLTFYNSSIITRPQAEAHQRLRQLNTVLEPGPRISDKFTTYPRLGGKNNSGARGVKGTPSHMVLSGESGTILADESDATQGEGSRSRFGLTFFHYY